MKHETRNKIKMNSYRTLCQGAISQVTMAAKRAAVKTDGFTAYHLAYTTFQKHLDEAVKKTEEEMKEFVLKSNIDLFKSEGCFWNEVPKDWKNAARREHDRRKRQERKEKKEEQEKRQGVQDE